MTGPAPRPDSLRRTGPPPPELAVACPHCHAPPGQRCTTPRGRPLHVWINRPEQEPLRALARQLLHGRSLTCWCPAPEPGQPDHCHAAVLLALAAEPPRSSGSTTGQARP